MGSKEYVRKGREKDGEVMEVHLRLSLKLAAVEGISFTSRLLL